MNPDVTIKHLGIEYCERNDVSFTMKSPHSHFCYELYYLSKGERRYFIHDKTYLVREGSIVLIPPYVIHKAINADDPYHERYLLYIDEKQLSGVLKQMENMDWFKSFNVEYPVIRLEPMVHKTMTKQMDELIELNKDDTIVARNTYLLKVLNLLCSIGELEDYVSLQGRIEEDEQKTEMNRRIHEIVVYINTHYKDKISLEFLSKKYYLSTYYLSRSFKAVTGFGFNDYLNQVRVLEAEKLLLNTNATILEIAMKVGFGSSTNFGRVFKTYKGVTAKVYRG